MQYVCMTYYFKMNLSDVTVNFSTSVAYHITEKLSDAGTGGLGLALPHLASPNVRKENGVRSCIAIFVMVC